MRLHQFKGWGNRLNLLIVRHAQNLWPYLLFHSLPTGHNISTPPTCKTDSPFSKNPKSYILFTTRLKVQYLMICNPGERLLGCLSWSVSLLDLDTCELKRKVICPPRHPIFSDDQQTLLFKRGKNGMAWEITCPWQFWNPSGHTYQFSPFFPFP